MKNIEVANKGLSGAEMLGYLRKGHLVRRACWVDGVCIRITNERGFDGDGNAVFWESDSLYTLCSDGYFLHLGYSNQPFRYPRTYRNQHGYFEVLSRDGEGVGMLFADDWEEYGFMSNDEFRVYRDIVKDEVCKTIQLAVNVAIEKAKMEAQND